MSFNLEITQMTNIAYSPSVVSISKCVHLVLLIVEPYLLL